jgi:hypothetical protein
VSARLTCLDGGAPVIGAAVYFWIGQLPYATDINLGYRITNSSGVAVATFTPASNMVGKAHIVLAEFRGWGQYAVPLPWNSVAVTR